MTTGFTLAGADHAIIPVMLGDAKLAQIFAKSYSMKVFMSRAFYPVVPQGQARIRTQMSAAHSEGGYFTRC